MPKKKGKRRVVETSDDEAASPASQAVAGETPGNKDGGAEPKQMVEDVSARASHRKSASSGDAAEQPVAHDPNQAFAFSDAAPLCASSSSRRASKSSGMARSVTDLARDAVPQPVGEDSAPVRAPRQQVMAKRRRIAQETFGDLQSVAEPSPQDQPSLATPRPKSSMFEGPSVGATVASGPFPGDGIPAVAVGEAGWSDSLAWDRGLDRSSMSLPTTQPFAFAPPAVPVVATDAFDAPPLLMPAVAPRLEALYEDATRTKSSARQYLRHRRGDRLMDLRMQALGDLSRHESLRFHQDNKNRAIGQWTWTVLDQRIADRGEQAGSFPESMREPVAPMFRNDASRFTPLPNDAALLPDSRRTALLNDAASLNNAQWAHRAFPLDTFDARFVPQDVRSAAGLTQSGQFVPVAVDLCGGVIREPVVYVEPLRRTAEPVSAAAAADIAEESPLDIAREPRSVATSSGRFAHRRPVVATRGRATVSSVLASSTRWVPEALRPKLPPGIEVGHLGARGGQRVRHFGPPPVAIAESDRVTSSEAICRHPHTSLRKEAGCFWTCDDCGELLVYDGWRAECSLNGFFVQSIQSQQRGVSPWEQEQEYLEMVHY